MVNDLQLEILEQLVDGPKKKSELFQRYSSSNDQKPHSDEHFPMFLDLLERKGWITQVLGHSNQVWCVLTDTGYYEILETKTPQKLLALRQAKLRRALLAVVDIEGRDVDWDSNSNYTRGMKERLETSRRKIAELSALLSGAEGRMVKGQVLATLMAEVRRPNGRTAARQNMIELLKKELSEADIAKAENIAGRKLIRLHAKDGVAFEGGPKVYGKCFFCGADIVVKDAAEEARLLTKYGGRKGKIVCCGCFDHMQWMEKQFGGSFDARDTKC
jgi:hypothetical protein